MVHIQSIQFIGSSWFVWRDQNTITPVIKFVLCFLLLLHSHIRTNHHWIDHTLARINYIYIFTLNCICIHIHTHISAVTIDCVMIRNKPVSGDVMLRLLKCWFLIFIPLHSFCATQFQYGTQMKHMCVSCVCRNASLAEFNGVAGLFIRCVFGI